MYGEIRALALAPNPNTGNCTLRKGLAVTNTDIIPSTILGLTIIFGYAVFVLLALSFMRVLTSALSRTENTLIKAVNSIWICYRKDGSEIQ